MKGTFLLPMERDLVSAFPVVVSISICQLPINFEFVLLAYLVFKSKKKRFLWRALLLRSIQVTSLPISSCPHIRPRPLPYLFWSTIIDPHC